MSRFTIILCLALLGVVRSFAVEPVKFIGFTHIGKNSVACLATADDKAKWCGVGESFAGFTVKEIKTGGAALVVATDAAGALVTLPLDSGTHVAGEAPAQPKTLTPLSELDWKWIKSDANPMRRRPEEPPGWATENWNDLTRDVKIDLQNYYRAHGWEIVKVETRAPGSYHVSIAPLKDPSEPVPTEEERRKSAVSAGKISPPK